MEFLPDHAGRRARRAGGASRRRADHGGHGRDGGAELRPAPASALLDLTRVEELATWERVDEIRLGAGVTYTRVVEELAVELPGLALASHGRSRRSATAARSAGTSAPRRPPVTPTPRCSPRSPRSSLARRYAACPRTSSTPAEEARRPSRRAGHRGLGARRHRPAAVQQDRHPQRHGDRRRRLRPGPPPRARGRHRHRLGGAHAAPGDRRRDVPRGRAGLGAAARRARRRRHRVRAAGGRRGVADRRRARHRGVPPARPRRHGPALPRLGLDRPPEEAA